ncbi:hypothetical protein Tco_0849935 [Tanacetum coccineum]
MNAPNMGDDDFHLLNEIYDLYGNINEKKEELEQWGNILKSIDEGPFKMGKFRETLAEGALHLGPERDRVFADLTPEEKERFKADIRATNILLQEGSELTKDERKSQLYDEFEHFRQNKGETIHEYYVRFTKPINDMRNIKMTMPKMQLNSKFVNNMLHEWGRFVTAVKLNRGLKKSNYDQLYAYLKQHEAHANEKKMMLERYNQHAIDPLAFVSNVSPQQYPTQSLTIPQYAYVPSVTHQPQFADYTPLDSGITPTDDLIENLTKTGRQNKGQGNYARGAVAARNGGAQNRVGNTNPAVVVYCRCNMFDDDVDEASIQYLALNEDNIFHADQCDAFDSDIDEAPTAQTMFMANLSSADPIYDEAGPSYDSGILSEYVKDNAVQVVQSSVSFVSNDALMMIINDMHEQSAQCVIENEQNKVVNELLIAELARYKEQVELYEKRAKFELTAREQKGIQTALVKEVKEMKEIFEQMEAEVEQNAIDKLERISKKRTKNEAKTTKPDSEWKSRKKTKSKSKPKPEKVNRKSTQVNPEAKKSRKVSLGTKLVNP